MTLLMSFISLFEINKAIPFPAFILLNPFIAFKVKLLTNPGKLPLAKGITMFVGAFFPKSPNQEPKDPPD